MKPFYIYFLRRLYFAGFFFFIAAMFAGFQTYMMTDNFLLTGFCVLLLFHLFFLFLRWLLQKGLKPLDEAEDVARRLAEGDFSVRAYEYNPASFGRLNRTLNRLARNLARMMNSYEVQQDWLGTLIENIGSGLLFIDEDGRATLVNQTYKETFLQNTRNWYGCPFECVLPDEDLAKVVKEAFVLELPIEKQIVVPLGIERKYFAVHGAPILTADRRSKGIVLVFHDITELKKLEQMRKDFVANVSHELKTPVTSLKGFVETLLDGAMNDRETAEKFLKILLKESERLQTLIDDLLELSRIEQPQFRLKWQRVDLASLLQEVCLMLKEKAEKKGIEFVHTVEGDTTVEGDPDRLQQIFLNLMNNAVVYSYPNQKVYLSLQAQNDVVRFSVKDSGVGIAKNEIPRIFERFYRVDKARSRNSGGTGLGLAIVKHLVEAHGGKIDVESIPGKGTTFTITLYKSRNV